MGCWISAPKRKERKNTTFDGEYVAVTPPTRGLSKRLWKSRHSYASSSGISSDCNTPLRGSKAYSSRCNSLESPSAATPTKKNSLKRPESKDNLIYENLPAFLRNVPLDIEIDDYLEDQFMEKHFNIEACLDESGGYYTEESSDCSTPLGTVNTQGENEELHNSTTSEFELDMEMRMMGKAFGIMPKTSSPVFQRRDVTFDMPTVYTAPMPAPSASYQKWRRYLQMTPTYALHNITDIPEAIAGRFCPAEFPGYSEVRGFSNAIAIKSASHHQRNQHIEAAEIIAETIIMELPVATITTEL